jgi:CheY-like chemotaxis protein
MINLGIGLPKAVGESLGSEMIKRGHRLKMVSNKLEAEEILQKETINFCIADLEAKLTFNLFNFIQDTMNEPGEQHPKWITLGANTEEEFIREVISLGIVGYISKRQTTEVIVEKILELIKQKANIHERRRHVRVTPRMTDDLSFNIPVPNNETYLKGRIVNISLGGALLDINQRDLRMLGDYQRTSSFFRPGEHFTKVQLALNKRLLLVDTMVVVVRDNLVGVKFLHPSEAFLNSVARYVFNRMIEE